MLDRERGVEARAETQRRNRGTLHGPLQPGQAQELRKLSHSPAFCFMAATPPTGTSTWLGVQIQGKPSGQPGMGLQGYCPLWSPAGHNLRPHPEDLGRTLLPAWLQSMVFVSCPSLGESGHSLEEGNHVSPGTQRRDCGCVRPGGQALPPGFFWEAESAFRQAAGAQGTLWPPETGDMGVRTRRSIV